MKKIAILLLLGAVAWTAGAQRDTRAEVMAAPGCFYRWDDFVQRYSTIPQ